MLDYNYKEENRVNSAELSSVEIRGYGQPVDVSLAPIPYSYTHAMSRSGICFHPDESTDLAVINATDGNAFSPSIHDLIEVLCAYTQEWFASESEIDGLWPGDEVFIPGYPGMAGGSERPVLVKGIIASDPRYPAVFGNATNLGNAVLCHSFSWNGMSGAPVLGFSESIGKTKVIGINAGHVGGSGVTGGVISHFVRSSALIELLEVASAQWHAVIDPPDPLSPIPPAP
ncbi:trypsin-like peptidase domain-containing protein [Mycobacterium stomatepiae]|uniref:trypsin-like peptidase domain-containing protein n=1 Tax=Mycobacterium stomatepiae TaxID=470076 RepID=UPI0013CF5D54|nr:trypsin-like peptidase domain-containing protein [Mycobacterium stomatepiae]MCV7164999.1 hypothetical protein [Mycobacterium stomatepiae]